MLLQLNIQNFAIVRALDIDWQAGMTTITGETGAGKSIAIDALGLCLGQRALINVVRPGTKKAALSATFAVKNNAPARQWLEQHELTLDNECILRRVISAEGRSKAYINGNQVPLAQLKQVGQLLINIHGQHDHQLIVKANEQRRLLDDYANHQHLLDEVKYHQQHYRKLTNELGLLQQSKRQNEAKQQLLQYQVSELNEFALQQREFETLEADYKRHSNSQQLVDETLQTLQTLSEGNQFNVLDGLRRSCDALAMLSNLDAGLLGITSLLNECLIQIEDANVDLRHYYDALEVDPSIYAALEQRYSQAIQLAKKHQVMPENLFTLQQTLIQKLSDIGNDEVRLLAVHDEIEITAQAYFDAAIILSQSRCLAAKALSTLISNSMQELNMPHGRFEVSVKADLGPVDSQGNDPVNISQLNHGHISSHGIDNVCFVVSLNPGQPLEAIDKVASGGELSRISLAIQVILADKVITPALIFDEVDVGISGPTAAMVGKKLQQLAKNTQVICVTHLPQVASKGHQQLFVTKFTDGEHTQTQVMELNKKERVQEIARLLAGDSITKHSLANAKELLAS